MDKSTALRKIQKCLALSKSAEPHEAAGALRQAQALMAQFDIDHPELLAANVNEEWAKSRATSSPPRYEVMLANVVADTFGCSMLFSSRMNRSRREGGYKFIGTSSAAQVAGFTFIVLARKLVEARAAYSKAKLGRYTKNKVAAADQFCEGWVLAVSRQVAKADLSEENHQAIEAYMGMHYASLGELKPRSRELANAARGDQHHHNGWVEGKKAQVNTGLGSSAPQGQLSLGEF